jgi:hypothetical protein
MNRHLAMLILAATLLAQPAAAQDNEEPQAPPTSSRRSDLTSDCVPREGLSLCLNPAKAARRVRKTVKEQAGRIGRFARIAGLFMGRSDAAEIGSLKLRVNLEIR